MAQVPHIPRHPPTDLTTIIMPPRWRISFHPEEEICPKNRACFQTIPNHIDGASQGFDDEDKSLFLNAFATANPPQPAELPCLGGLDRWGQNYVRKCACQCQPPRPAELPWLGRAWTAQVRKGLDDEDKIIFWKCVCQCQPPTAGRIWMRFKGHRWRNSFLNRSKNFLALEWDLMDIDGATHEFDFFKKQ